MLILAFSGKTTLVLQILEKRNEIIRLQDRRNKPINNIIYFCETKQKIFDEFKKTCKYIHFVDSIAEVEQLLKKNEPNILVFDDIFVNLTRKKSLNEYVTNWAVQRTHHEFCATVRNLKL